MPDFEDYLKSQTATASATIGRLAEMAHERRAIALAASGVKADPNWTKYADALEAQRQIYEKHANTCDERILSAGIMTPEDYANLKLDQVRWRTKAETLKFAIYYINTLMND
jgi:hypothetical protein